MKGRNVKHSENVIYIISLLLFFPFSSAQSSPSNDSNTWQSNKFQFNPVLGMVIFCLIFAFLVMAFVPYFSRHCFEREYRWNFTFNEANRYPRRTYTPGIEQVLIDTFPTFLYSDVKEHKICKAELECAVCLNEFEDSETIRLLPICCHVFHLHCIDAWLISHVTCPVCRANLIPVPGEDQSDPNNEFDSIAEPTQPTRLPEGENHACDNSESAVVINIGSPEVTNVFKNHLHRLIPEKSKLSRSHSTGHSTIHRDRNPKKLMQVRIGDRNMAFSSVMSSKKGFRSNSFGSSRERNYNHEWGLV